MTHAKADHPSDTTPTKPAERKALLGPPGLRQHHAARPSSRRGRLHMHRGGGGGGYPRSVRLEKS